MKFISPVISIHGRKMVKYTMMYGKKKTHVHAAHMSTPEKAMFRRPIKAKAKESLEGKSQIMSQIYKERTNNTSAW